MTINLTNPSLILVYDYHEFAFQQDTLNRISANKRSKIVVCEIGFHNHQYVGLVYQGRKPNKKVIEKLLERSKIVLEIPVEF